MKNINRKYTQTHKCKQRPFILIYSWFFSGIDEECILLFYPLACRLITPIVDFNSQEIAGIYSFGNFFLKKEKFQSCCTQTTNVCANLTHSFKNPQHVSACQHCFHGALLHCVDLPYIEYSFLCTLVASPINLYCLFCLLRNIVSLFFFMYFNNTDTQCHNGYILFVKVKCIVFFFADIYIYTVCMCVYVKCMHCVQYHYQL